MTDKEVIMIDGKDCTNCNKFSHCNNNNLICRSRYYKVKEELQYKEQEIAELKEKYKWYDHYKDSALFNKDLCNKKSNELKRLQAENEELKDELQISKDDHAYAVELEKDVDRYKQALEKIKFEVAEELKTLEADCDEYGTFLQIAKLINEVLKDETY